MAVLDKLLRVGEGKKVKALQGLVPDINAREPEYQKLTDAELQGKTAEFRQQLDNGADLTDILIDAFATVREASSRTIGQRHYDVQLMGGAALHYGWVAEMKTGEGKTLVSTLPVYLNGLTGKGLHVITVNDYLATRDAEWMGQIHGWLGLTIGLILPGQNTTPDEKRAQYACDITYGTNNEFGFDYLRDNMALRAEQKVQRGHVYAIVDEVDSILVDEARTPLIISGTVAEAAALYKKFALVVKGLKPTTVGPDGTEVLGDYDIDEEKRIVAPTEAGVAKVEAALGVENLYDSVQQNLVHQLQAALKAKELYKRDKDYIVQGNEVKIVDEFTGRILEGRRWSEGLHQAVEAKENVNVNAENQTLATVTLQNYFRMYDKLAGMTGTAVTEAAEFASTYNLQVVPIPTHRTLLRKDNADLIYKFEQAKYEAVVEDIAERYETGQPVLVGTISVAKSEKLSSMLNKRGVPHEVLNAKQHTREAEIVTQAGRLHSITVATNMAGRGVDILLGGNPEGLALRDLRAEGVDVESDEGQARLGELTAKYKVETDAEGDEVRELGGLYVLGTERHDSRRIDNQLRGRSGRQGDPGESRFYLSLEDDLMRLFATGAANWVMGKAFPDDVPIEARMVSKGIERAQNTVEQRNAEIRKNVLKYDEVMNEQRKVIYKRRDQILGESNLRDEVIENLDEIIEGAVQTFCVVGVDDEWDLDGLRLEIDGFWPTELSVEEMGEVRTSEELVDVLRTEALTYYEQREVELGEERMRDLERACMLSLIDSHWREHLLEMDYLEEGIHLRSMAQRDPLVEWQREGFEMFGAMMSSIAQDFVRWVMRASAEVRVEQTADVRDVVTSGPDDPSSEPGGAMASAAQAQGATAEADVVNTPVVKSDLEKVGRNDPCHCGSGKKYKLCHGR